MFTHVLRAGLIVAFCCLFAGAPQAAMKIGVLPASDALALHIAKEEGLFSKHGLEVELVPFQSALEQSAAVRSGALQGWFTDPIAMMLLHESGVPQRVIATMSFSASGHRFFGIAVAPGSSITDAQGLKGASISISQATIIEYMLDAMLESEKLPRDHANRVDIKQISVRLQLLLAGKVDAAVLPEPLLSMVEAKGSRVILDNTGFSGPLAITSLRQDAVDPVQVAAFQTALGEAMRRITADPEKYRERMTALRLLPKAASPKYRMIRYEESNTPLPLPTVPQLETIARWMMRVGLLKKMPAVAEIVPE